jgi:hypothetical protein
MTASVENLYPATWVKRRRSNAVITFSDSKNLQPASVAVGKVEAQGEREKLTEIVFCSYRAHYSAVSLFSGR